MTPIQTFCDANFIPSNAMVSKIFWEEKNKKKDGWREKTLLMAFLLSYFVTEKRNVSVDTIATWRTICFASQTWKLKIL